MFVRLASWFDPSFGVALPLDPNLAVLKKFFLPNRHRAFEFAYGPFAGLKCRAAVRCADGDDYAGLADFQTPGPVHDTDVGDVELLMRLLAQALHLANRHRRVSIVNQMERAAAASPLARITVERHGGAALG